MPILGLLSAAGFSIWPFDPPGWPRVIEIYPRALTQRVRKSSHLDRAGYLAERFGRFQLPISGGGYFRLYPGALFRRLVRRAIGRDGHYLMYLHSWEFDPEMPRFKIPGFGLGFRHYNNLSLTLSRMRALVGMLASMGTRFLTISEFLEELPRGRAVA